MKAMNITNIIKKTICLFGAAVSLLTVSVSCDKWLTAVSTSQISDQKLFQTRLGYEEALTGVYISMAQPECYGMDYTWWVCDAVAYPYTAMQQANYRAFQSHLYTTNEAQPILESMWKSGYFVIANANKILTMLEENGSDVLEEAEYRLIKGELLAVRAYVHFDLSRMFDKYRADLASSEKLAIPYQLSYDKEPCPQLSYAETYSLILKDIAESLELLADTDPIVVGYSDAFNRGPNVNGYWEGRRKHLNYYAVKALQARVYQWFSDYKNAAKSAQEVIDAVFDKEIVTWVDPDAQLKIYDNDARDWTFSSEHLFSLEVTELHSSVLPYFFSPGQGSGYYVPVEVVENSFFFRSPFSDYQGGMEDIRGSAMWLSYSGDHYTVNKLYGSSTQAMQYRNILPMLKISEMYYIMAENEIFNGSLSQAAAYMDIVRHNRGVTDDYATSQPYLVTDQHDCGEELMKEYFREFIGEGQVMYMLKKFFSREYIKEGALVDFPMTISMDIKSYQFPYPVEEIAYGRIQDI